MILKVWSLFITLCYIIFKRGEPHLVYKIIVNLYRYNQLKNPYTNELNNLLTVWHNYSTKYDINYSLAYGSLLGYYRNKNYIPYDHDVDLWVDKDDLDKIINMPESFYTDEEHKDYNGYKLVIYKDHDSKMNNRKRWNRYGKLVKSQIDPYSFNGPIGRLVFNDNIYIDIFLFHKSSKNNVKKLVQDGWILGLYGDLGEYVSSKYATNLPKTKITKINNVTTRVISNETTIREYLYNIYGPFFRYPNRPLLF